MSETNKNEVTVKQFHAVLAEIKTEKAKAEQMKKDLTAQNVKVQRLLSTAAGYMKELGLDNFKGPDGLVYVRRVWSWKLPEDGEPFKAFRSWLAERGIEDEYLTVHSGKFNTLVKEEKEAAEKEGRLLSIPGVGDPTLFETVVFNK